MRRSDDGQIQTSKCEDRHHTYEDALFHCESLNSHDDPNLSSTDFWEPVELEPTLETDDSTDYRLIEYNDVEELQEKGIMNGLSVDDNDDWDHFIGVAHIGEVFNRIKKSFKKLRKYLRPVLFVLGGLVVGAIIVFIWRSDDGLDGAVSRLNNEAATEREQRETEYLESLQIAADDELESFIIICSERTNCFNDLIILGKWACHLVHTTSLSAGSTHVWDEAAISALEQPLQILRNEARYGEPTWHLLPDERIPELAADIVRATSKPMCY